MSHHCDRWVTARHEAAHATVNHALAIHTVRLSLSPTEPREGYCEPEPVFEQFCADNELAHPIGTPQEHVWSVIVAKRHAVAALAGIAMENILSPNTDRIPIAEDSEYDLSIAEQDLMYALKYVGNDSQAYVSKPDIKEELTRALAAASTILSWPSAQAAVEELAKVLLQESDISDSTRVRSIVEKCGLFFGEALPAFVTCLLVRETS